MNRRIIVLASLLAVALIALGVILVTERSESESGSEPRERCIDEAVARHLEVEVDAPVTLAATLVAALENAVALIDGPTGTDEMWAITKEGRLHAIGPDGSATTILDIVDEVELGWEQGLLGIQLSLDESELFISYVDTTPASVIERMPIVDGRPVDDERIEVLRLDQPHQWHNAGQLQFGPDGLLWFALGDGGNELDDPQLGRRAAEPTNWFGSILRIDVSEGSGPGYAIPEDNPFVDSDDGAPEVFVYGLRNPWRFSIEGERNELWIGDVGQSCWEEINRVPLDEAGGTDFGWPRLEANHVFRGGEPHGEPPLYAYPRVGGRLSVSGGFVYDGEEIPELDGAYLFGDFGDGLVRALWFDGEQVEVAELGAEVPAVVSFHHGTSGLYAVSHTDGVYRLEPAAAP